MKQFVLIALVAIFVVSGCASMGGSAAGGNQPQEDTFWFITSTEGGMRARNNQVTLRKGETYLYIYFKNDMPGNDFDKVQLDFTVDRPIDFKWQAAYMPGAVWGTNEEILIKGVEKGPLESDLSDLKESWFNMTDFKDGLEKSQINGICLRVTDPEGRAVFTLTNVVFIGLAEGE